MPRRMPIAPITRPSESRSAEAFRVVGVTSPEAVRGLSTALRVTPRSAARSAAAILAARSARGQPAWVDHRVARDAALDHLAQGGGELARLLRADETRDRLLHHLIRPEAQELGDRVVGEGDLALQVRYEHGIGGVLDQALGVGAGLVELAHVAQDADRADHLAVGVPQRRGVERRGDHLARGAAGIEHRVPGDAVLDHLVEGGHELARLYSTPGAAPTLSGAGPRSLPASRPSAVSPPAPSGAGT